MKKRFLPLSMLLITMVLAQAGHVANAAGIEGKYVPRSNSEATVSSYMKSIRTNQETGLIDPAALIKAQKAAMQSIKGATTWDVVGPDNYGGLTRAMLYDETDPTNNTLLIGTMGGRIFESTNGGITMRQVSGNFNALISDMIQVDGTIYVATGDGRNSFKTNTLADYGYETGFVGNGIWKMNNGVAEQIASTNPENDNGWAFVNELASSGTALNRIFAATNGGLRYTTNGGETWTTLIEGDATSVKMNGFGAGLATVDYNVYRINMNGEDITTTLLTVDEEGMLSTEIALKVLAMSPSDANYMYVGYVKYDTTAKTYSTGDIYYTNDGGNAWSIALPVTSAYDLFGSRGYIDNAMEVFPNNPKKVLVGGKNVWVLEYAAGASGTGIYEPTMISEGESNELAQLMTGYFDYVHVGIQSFQFNPDNSNVFFVGTEGGVFKGSYTQGNYKFSNCNRYFVTEDDHTSVARMFGVGISGYQDRVIGGCLDHGTILMDGSELINNITTGEAIFPNYDPTSGAATVNGHSVFTEKYAGGPCAISTFDGDVMFVTTTGSMTTPLYRTRTAGYDYDMSNFYNEDNALSKVITNANVFRTPIAMYENYNDEYSLRTTYYAAIDSVRYLVRYILNENPTDTLTDSVPLVFARPEGQTITDIDTIVLDNPIHRAGEEVDVFSNIEGFPFKYVLPNDVNKGDSVFGIKDIMSATLVCGIEDNIYMTKNSHYFSELSEWWRIGKINGIPSAVAISNDGDMTIVGTMTGELYRVSNLREAVTAEQANIDSTGCVVVFNTLDNQLFAGRTITAISVVNGKVLVSTGNYGNDNYVFLSENNGDSFVSIQGNLPKAPVYSCLIEKTTGDLIAGTEHGIFIYKNGTWTHNGDVVVPVTDLKQAIVENRDAQIVISGYDVKYEPKDTIYTPLVYLFYGVDNDGWVYASTYGNGIIKCGDYKITSGGELNITENNFKSNALQLDVYPNPVVGTAHVSFELSESASVRFDIYDLSGRIVSSRILGTYAQGSHNATFNVDNLTSGTYIVRIQAGNSTQSSKIVVL